MQTSAQIKSRLRVSGTSDFSTRIEDVDEENEWGRGFREGGKKHNLGQSFAEQMLKGNSCDPKKSETCLCMPICSYNKINLI